MIGSHRPAACIEVVTTIEPRRILRRIPGGGLRPPYTYRVVQGSLPPGTSIQRFNNGTRIAGTPTTAGTFSFSLVSTDSRGSQSAATLFSIVVHPRA